MCSKCGGTGELRIPCGPGVSIRRCSCSPIVTKPENERTKICPTCKGEGLEEVPSSEIGKLFQSCSNCGGSGRV